MNALSSSHFCHQDHPGPVPDNQLEPIFSFRPEDENIAAVGIGDQCLRDHRNQPMHAAPKINRLRRQQNLQLATKADHEARRSAVNTTDSVLASTPVGTRTSAPNVSISIIRVAGTGRSIQTRLRHRPSHSSWPSLRGQTVAPASLPLPEPAPLRVLRQQCSRPPLTPCRRATAEIFAPGSKLSAKMRARSSSLLRRWRGVPVINSTRR